MESGWTDCCEPGQSEAQDSLGRKCAILGAPQEALVFSLEPSGWLALSFTLENLLELIGQLFEFPVLVPGDLCKVNMRFANHDK